MQVYRADEADAVRFVRLLSRESLLFEVERFGSKVAYVTVRSLRPDVPELARSAGASVRRVLSLDQLTAPGDR